jgi:hypothetical protein
VNSVIGNAQGGKPVPTGEHNRCPHSAALGNRQRSILHITHIHDASDVLPAFPAFGGRAGTVVSGMAFPYAFTLWV